MSFVGRKINAVLVLLIILVVIIATGTTIIYQRGLSARTRAYEVTQANLSQCTTALENYRERLQQKESELKETSADIAKYDTLYEQKVAELEKTQDLLESTRRQLSTVRLQKEQFKNLYGKALLNISVLQERVADLQEDVASLRRQVSNLQDELDSCGGG